MSDNVTPAAESPVPTPVVAPATGAMGFWTHVLALVCAGALIAHTFPLVIGVVWLVFVLRRTGFRARDAWLVLVPGVNVYLMVRCLWRATSTEVTWSVRPELRSEPLAMWTSPARWFAELSGP